MRIIIICVLPTPPTTTLLLDTFADNYHDLIRFVARRTRDRQIARELVHEAWLRMAERRANGADPGRADTSRAYLYKVAEHLAIDHLRRARRTQERFDASASGAEGRTPDVADVCCQREALAAVDAALRRLPARCRSMFLADRIDGLPQAEIAAQHGVSVKTVEREVMRAMDAMEEALHRWRGSADVPPRCGRRRALSTLLGVVGLGAGGSIIWQLWREHVPNWQAQLATRTGRQLIHTLPDGSTIALDARSRARISYYAARRHVHLLAGIAFFSVARDASRPFTVEGGQACITALGTRFEVDLATDGALRVAVEEGRVRIQSRRGVPSEQDWELGPRDILHWPAGAAPRREIGSSTVASWRDGWLDFRHETLGQAVRRLARYSRRPIRVAPGARDLPVFGRVRIAEAHAWLQLLPRSLPVTLREEGEGAQRSTVIERR